MIPHQPTITHFYANMQYHILPYADQRDTFVAEENKEFEMSYTLAANIYFTTLHEQRNHPAFLGPPWTKSLGVE